MKERPILFSGPMVRAIIDGRKTQTRRILTIDPAYEFTEIIIAERDTRVYFELSRKIKDRPLAIPICHIKCPFGTVGDHLWLRETWAVGNPFDHVAPSLLHDTCAVDYAADEKRIWSPEDQGRWRPSIHMPRWASRITLEITDISVQRLQDIGKDGRKAKDVLSEGITKAAIEREREWFHPDDAPAIAFSRLWNSLQIDKNSGKPGASWSDNPLVWAITFKAIQP